VTFAPHPAGLELHAQKNKGVKMRVMITILIGVQKTR